MSGFKMIGYIALWSVGYIAVHALVSNPMDSLQNLIAGSKNQGGQ
tara:strand:+ start:1866 stop:2000 length:135 start_codon:yes stop_codon:yes gene_type:complete